MNSKKLEGLLIRIVLLISSIYFYKNLACVSWTQRFEKAHESKYQNIFLNKSPDLIKTLST